MRPYTDGELGLLASPDAALVRAEAIMPDSNPAAPPSRPTTSGVPDSAAALANVLERHLSDLQAGRAPDPARLLAEHPELAEQLGPCLAGLEFIHHAARQDG